jgi:DNA-binding transcriptional ArsR family regulator
MTIIQSMAEDDKAALAALSSAIFQFRDPNSGAPMPPSMLLTFITVAQKERTTVADISTAAGITQSATSRQLADLGSKIRIGGAGLNLIEQRMEGVFTQNSLTPKGRELARRMAGEMRKGRAMRVAA